MPAIQAGRKGRGGPGQVRAASQSGGLGKTAGKTQFREIERLVFLRTVETFAFTTPETGTHFFAGNLTVVIAVHA